MTALVCSVQLAVDFQTRSATLASGNGESMGMSGQVDMMSISLNIRQSIRFTVETRNRIFGSICTFPRHAVPATRRQVLV